jgi:hypothetical protein
MRGSPEEQAAWSQLLEGWFRGLRSRPSGVDRPVGSLTQIRLGAVDVFSMTGNAQRVSRSAGAERDASLGVAKITMMTRGTGWFSQAASEFEVRPGEFAVYPASLPFQMTLPQDRWSCVVVTAPCRCSGCRRAC